MFNCLNVYFIYPEGNTNLSINIHILQLKMLMLLNSDFENVHLLMIIGYLT
jgi:hypothetical protein